MSDELKFGLDDLEVADDLDVSLDNDTYQDQANPAPPAAGTYSIRALGLDYKKYRDGDRQGQPVLVDGKFPILTLGMAEIIEGLPEGNTRKVGLFQDLGTKPFDRYGTPASGFNDVMRAYGSPNFTNLSQGLDILKEHFQNQDTLAVQLDWNVYDGDFVAAAFEQLDIDPDVKNADRDDDERKLVNAIYRAARTTGMRNFPYDADRGRFIHVMQLGDVTFKNPVTGANVTIEVPHRAIEARLTVTKWIPRKDVEAGRVRFGASNVKPKAVAA